jgi:hypothetical protein
MADNKKSFILFCDQTHLFQELDDDEAGRLIKHIFRYVNDEDPEPPDRITKIAFEPIKQQLKRNLKDWEFKKNQKSEAGKKGMESRWAKHNEEKQSITSDNSVINPITNITVSVNDNVTVSDTVNENVNDNVIFIDEPKFLKLLTKKEIPTEEEFISYYKTELEKEFPNRLFAVKAKFETWIDDGWKDGNGNKIKNWKLKLKNTITHLKPVPTNFENQQLTSTKLTFKNGKSDN